MLKSQCTLRSEQSNVTIILFKEDHQIEYTQVQQQK
jgi:hypothetical protein